MRLSLLALIIGGLTLGAMIEAATKGEIMYANFLAVAAAANFLIYRVERARERKLDQ